MVMSRLLIHMQRSTVHVTVCTIVIESLELFWHSLLHSGIDTYNVIVLLNK